MPQRHRGHHLGNLLERARPTGKGNECIAELDHLGLALGHVARHDEIVDTVVLKLGLDKKARLHTRHVSACLEHAIGERAHQSRLGPAVYQRVAVGANPVSQLLHRGQKRRVVADVRAQVYRDIHLAPSSAGVGDIRARGVIGRRVHRDRDLPNVQDRP